MKTVYKPVLALCGIMASNLSYAALSPGANLNFSSGSSLGTDSFTMPTPGTGSWFALQVSPNTYCYTGISAYNGLQLGTIQSASGSHSGSPNGNESPGIDNPWSFFSNTGMHRTHSPVNIVSDDNNGHVLLDFSGWGLTWNGVAVDSLGGGSWGSNPDGMARMRCQNNCSGVGIVEGDTEWWSLDYTATIPAGDPSGLGSVQYQLHLESVNYVPLPGAIWLFGSGVLGLVGIAGRYKRQQLGLS